MKNYLNIKLLFLIISFGCIGCEKDNSEIEENTLRSTSNLEVSTQKNEVEQIDLVAIKYKNGKYLSSEQGRKPIRCNRDKIGPWEIFELIDLGDRKYALKGSNGKYVSSENGRKAMTCNRKKVGAWESFFIGSTEEGSFFSQWNKKWTNNENIYIYLEDGKYSDHTLTCKKVDIRDDNGSLNQNILFTIEYL